jgi:two-component system sensor histidine kinase/response regulator
LGFNCSIFSLSPLVGIKNILSSFVLSHQSILDEKAKNDLRTITNALDETNLLVRDLLHFSKLTKIELSKKKVNMFNLVKKVCNEIKLGNENNAFEIILNELPDANCDPILVKQVWVNLISNAIKYSSKKKQPKIEISAMNIHGKTVYSVKDNGVDFNMKYADKLFVIFGRLDKKREFEGTGIGLTTVHRIISRHGGRVWVKAAENKGATFYFTLKS